MISFCPTPSPASAGKADDGLNFAAKPVEVASTEFRNTAFLTTTGTLNSAIELDRQQADQYQLLRQIPASTVPCWTKPDMASFE